MKKKLSVLFTMLAMALVLTACGSSDETTKTIETRLYEGDANKTFVKENDKLKFELDASNTHFTVTNKETGKVWTSNPTAEEIKAAGGAEGKQKYMLDSTLMIKYSNKTNTQVDIENYTNSIENKNYTIDEIENGIQVNYSIGNVEKEYLCPPAATKSRMEEFTSEMQPYEGKRIMGTYYKVYKYDELEGAELDDALEQFPNLKDEPMYVFSPSSESIANSVQRSFVKAGYTEEDYQQDKGKYKLKQVNKKPVFNVSIQYILEGDQLKVVVPMDKIDYREAYPIVELSVLPYMGAGSIKDNGYILVPEGTGGKINFNNGKTGQQYYVSNMYGWDYGVSRDMLVDETKSSFPLMGICKNGTSMLCVSEQGSSYAIAKADISGKGSNFNYGMFAYNMIHGEDMDISAKSDTTVRTYEKSLPKESIVQRYIFSDTDDYSKLAGTYREYLMNRYPELAKKSDAQVPFAVEMIGAVDNVEHILGYPVTRPQALTTYEQAKDITKQLVDAGAKPTNLKYTGWSNGGVKSTSTAKISLIGRLGSSSDLEDLASYANKNKVNMFMDGMFNYIMNDKMLDGFFQNRDAAKFVSREIAELHDFWPVTFVAHDDEDDSYYLTKPKYAAECLDHFMEKISSYGIKNVSINDYGSKLGADYNPKDACSREKNMKLQQQSMSKITKNGSKIMTQAGNQYAVPYSDMVTNMDITSKKINLIDETIPFYTMALHGLVNYSGNAINLAEDYELNLLRSVETGSGLYFTFMYQPTSVLQDGLYTKYFACNFKDWKEDTVNLYKRFQSELSDTYNQFMVEHKQIASGVYMTQYENGKKVYVNYNYNEYNVNGITIPARDFITQGGGQ